MRIPNKWFSLLHKLQFCHFSCQVPCAFITFYTNVPLNFISNLHVVSLLQAFVTGSGSGVTVGYKFTRCRLVSPTPLDNIARLTSNYATACRHFITTNIAPELDRAAQGVKGTFSQFSK
ncbi:hypothetical protein FQN60_009256 [Etheostoma spectabile]|uniref:Uncharacterized protein n=1 Tax=Etheostoma spectabile TaxID=54343 RepID=A0A5J5CA70_9PERO|nr:hypothetical protein FQN60_009256 [Etheostoma spectabile]